jgi:hypothetical protein
LSSEGPVALLFFPSCTASDDVVVEESDFSSKASRDFSMTVLYFIWAAALSFLDL